MPFKYLKNGFVKPGVYFEQGDVVLAEAAIMAGVRFYAGYPITPASEIMEHMALRLPMVDGTFIQMEDEIGAISAVIGASWGGLKAMTATSGPGFSLMQEMIGYAHMTETPCVIVNMQRAGPSTGQATLPGQGDVQQARWGTHGDHSAIALAPSSVKEMFDLTIRAFNLSEEYRTPVFLMGDAILGHLRERIEIPDINDIKIVNRKKPTSKVDIFFDGEGAEIPPMPIIGEGYNALVTGSTHDERGYRKVYDTEIHYKLVSHLINKIEKNKEKIIQYEMIGDPEADVLIVSYGTMARAIPDTIRLAKQEGIKVAGFRLVTLWPFPYDVLGKIADNASKVLVVEMNLGQIIRDVKAAVKDPARVFSLNRLSAGLFTPQEILREVKKIAGR
ncbi:MAG: 2-oxoacid:acceptor oxidoreductase subunit alpha [Candidatus Asgardarchaeia archaeon]